MVHRMLPALTSIEIFKIEAPDFLAFSNRLSVIDSNVLLEN